MIFPVGDAFEWPGATDVAEGQTQPHREEQKPVCDLGQPLPSPGQFRGQDWSSASKPGDPRRGGAE